MPKYLVEPTEKILVVCRSGQYEKNGPKVFFFGTIHVVLKKYGSQLLTSQRYGHIACTTLFKILCVPLKFVPWRLLYPLTRKGSRPFFYFHCKRLFFLQEFVFSTTSHVLKKWFFDPRSNCQETFWTLISSSLRFVTLNNTRKFKYKVFANWRTAYFFQKMRFQQPLGC